MILINRIIFISIIVISLSLNFAFATEYNNKQSMTKPQMVNESALQRQSLQKGMSPIYELQVGIGRLEEQIRKLQTSRTPLSLKQWRAKLTQLKKETRHLRYLTNKLQASIINVEKQKPVKGGKELTRKIKSVLEQMLRWMKTEEAKTKELTNLDKMGNFELQELMSRATQAKNLAYSLQKALEKSGESSSDHPG